LLHCFSQPKPAIIALLAPAELEEPGCEVVQELEVAAGGCRSLHKVDLAGSPRMRRACLQQAALVRFGAAVRKDFESQLGLSITAD